MKLSWLVLLAVPWVAAQPGTYDNFTFLFRNPYINP